MPERGHCSVLLVRLAICRTGSTHTNSESPSVLASLTDDLLRRRDTRTPTRRLARVIRPERSCLLSQPSAKIRNTRRNPGRRGRGLLINIHAAATRCADDHARSEDLRQKKRLQTGNMHATTKYAENSPDKKARKGDPWKFWGGGCPPEGARGAKTASGGRFRQKWCLSSLIYYAISL